MIFGVSLFCSSKIKTLKEYYQIISNKFLNYFKYFRFFKFAKKN
jgi:hypothetical protein